MPASRGRPGSRGKVTCRTAALLAAVLAVLSVAPAFGQDAARRILVVHSYHPEYGWTSEIMDGIRSVLGELPSNQLFVEYLDAKRFETPRLETAIWTTLEEKFRRAPPDLVLCSNDDALQFLLRHRAGFLRGVPVVFCSVYDPPQAAIPGVAGISARTPVLQTVELALRLRPATRTIAVVTDHSLLGQINRAAVERVAGEIRKRADLRLLSDLTVNELKEALRGLPPNSAVLFLSFLADRNGTILSVRDSLDLVVRNSRAPVYTCWDFMVKQGVLGGVVISGYQQGRSAAAASARVLAGASISRVDTRSPAVRTIIDPAALSAWGVPRTAVPPGSETVDGGGFYRRYSAVIWVALGALAVQSAWIALLAQSRERLRQSTRLLEDNVALLTALYDAVPAPLFHKDGRGVFRGCNALFAAQIAGTTPECVVGRRLGEIGPGFASETTLVSEQQDDAALSKNLTRYEAQLRCADGAFRDFLVYKAAYRETPDTGKGIVGIMIDVTERNRLERELHLHREQLLQAQKMESVGRLAGGVAHDFNNMLQVILGNMEVVNASVEARPGLRANLDEIHNAAQRSAELVRQLLAFARKQTVTPRVLDLNATIQDALSLLRRLIGEDVDLDWKPGRDLWPVQMDPSQVNQILANLCVNARDAIPGVGRIVMETDNITVKGPCGTSEAAPGDYVLLAVHDTGKGMPPEILRRVFEPFFTTKEARRNTGLGLATVYGAVKQNRGFINVHSEVGHGTSFRIYLPRASSKKTEAPCVQAPARIPTGGTETVLIAEDEPGILKFGSMVLRRLGYTVLPAATPQAALSLASERDGAIHLLITDVVMPGMNGRELRDRITALCPGVRTLFMSGYTSDVIARQGIVDEGVAFLQKPFSVHALSGKVDEILHHREQAGPLPARLPNP